MTQATQIDPTARAANQWRVVLFYDIVNSCGWTSALGQEDYKSKVLVPVKRLFDEAARSEGMEETWHRGDGQLTTFLDSEAAVITALQFHQRLREHAWSVAPRPSVRISIHAGQVGYEQTSDGQRELVGTCVNQGARIMGIAAADQTLTSGFLAYNAQNRGTDPRIQWVDHREYVFRGYRDDPIQIWEVTEAGATPRPPKGNSSGRPVDHNRRCAWRRMIIAALLLLGCWCVYGFRSLEPIDFFTKMEMAVHDRVIAAHHGGFRDSPVVVVAFDDVDAAALGHPVSDELLVQVLNRLLEARPRVIALDMFRPTAVGDPSHWSSFIKLLKDHDNIVQVYRYAMNDEESKFRGPPYDLAADIDRYHLDDCPPNDTRLARFGCADLPYDRDGKWRRGILVLGNDEPPPPKPGATPAGRELVPGSAPAFALHTAIKFLSAQKICLAFPDDPDEGWVQLGAHRFHPMGPSDGLYNHAADPGFAFPLDFRASFKTFSFGKLRTPGEVGNAELNDKIIVIGVVSGEATDIGASPLGTQTPGLFIQAHAIDQMIRAAKGEPHASGFFTQSQKWGLALAAAVWGLIVWCLGTSKPRAIVAWVVTMLLLAIPVLAAAAAGTHVPWSFPLINFIGVGIIAGAFRDLHRCRQSRLKRRNHEIRKLAEPRLSAASG